MFLLVEECELKRKSVLCCVPNGCLEGDNLRVVYVGKV